MTLSAILKRPSAFLPLVMSGAALALVAAQVVLHGTAPQADEGAAAHLFQLLLVAELPFVGFFAIKWLPQSPALAVQVLALQAAGGLTALAPVFFMGW